MKIPIVNEQDELIGYKEKKEILPEDIIRVSGIWVTDENGMILLQKRSLNKKSQPGMWQIAVAGTVEEGESYESNARKEVFEEIGVKDIVFSLGPKFRFYKDHNFFAQIFFAELPHDFPFKTEPLEVVEIKWFKAEEIIKLIEENSENEKVSPNLYEIFQKIVNVN